MFRRVSLADHPLGTTILLQATAPQRVVIPTEVEGSAVALGRYFRVTDDTPGIQARMTECIGEC